MICMGKSIGIGSFVTIWLGDGHGARVGRINAEGSHSLDVMVDTGGGNVPVSVLKQQFVTTDFMGDVSDNAGAMAFTLLPER
jgi:hypothetical protein